MIKPQVYLRQINNNFKYNSSMKKFILIICLFYTSLFSLEIMSHEIDKSKKAITLGTYLSLSKAKILANKFPIYSIYIKKPTFLNSKYYVVYAVNLTKQDSKNILNKVRTIVPTAYITSNKRVSLLSSLNENIVTTLESKDEVYKDIKNNDKLNFIDSSKSAITILYTKDIYKALEVAESLKGFTVYINSFKLLKDSAFLIYVVNIPNSKYNEFENMVKEKYEDAFKTRKSRIVYLSNNINKDNSFLYTSKDNFPKILKNRVVVKKTKKLKSNNSANLKYLKAKKYFNKKNYKETIKILEKLSENNSNNFGINYYLGRSYYNTKNYEKATAAFERANIVSSNNLRAKLELSQSYMMLGLYSEAATGFNEVLKNNVPTGVRNNISKRLEEINSLKKKGSFFGSIALGYTYDNNVNNITDTKVFNTPKYQNLVITDNIYADSYFSLLLNANYNYKINSSYSLNNTISIVTQNYNKDNERLNDLTSSGITKENKKALQLLSHNLQLSKATKNSIFSIGTDLSNIRIANDNYMNIYGINLSYQKRYFSNISFFSSLKLSKKLYIKDENKNLNSNNIQITIGESIPTNKYGTFSIVYYNTQEQKLIRDINAPNKNINGLILGNRYKLTTSLYTNILYLYNNTLEKSNDATFELKRDDSLSTLSLGIDYKLTKTLNITSSIKQIKNTSNIDIYSYDKKTFDIFFKKIF